RRCPARSVPLSSPGRDSPRRFPERSQAMRTRGAEDVGRFSVDIEVANYADLEMARRGLLPPDQGRRETIPGGGDSGATRLGLPGTVVNRLGVLLGDPIPVRYAAGRRGRRKLAEGVFASSSGAMGSSRPWSNRSATRPSSAPSSLKTWTC